MSFPPQSLEQNGLRNFDVFGNCLAIVFGHFHVQGVIAAAAQAAGDAAGDVVLGAGVVDAGFLVDPETVGLATGPYVGTGEALGALPVKAVPGLWYRASWGDSLHGMTTGEAVQAEDTVLYLGVIRQDGASGFYKVSVSDHAQ